MTSTKYIGLDVHKESISIAVLNSAGKVVMECTAGGPLRDFYKALLAKGRKPTMARLTLARKIAAITLIVWKKEVRFDANYLKQAA
jgi:hypothetical protein